MNENCFNCVKSEGCIHTWKCYDNPDGFICTYGFEPRKEKSNIKENDKH